MGPEGESAVRVRVIDDFLIRARALGAQIRVEGAGLERMGVNRSHHPGHDHGAADPPRPSPEGKKGDRKEGGNEKEHRAG